MTEQSTGSDAWICGSCGVGEIHPVARAGRRMLFHNFPCLEVPSDLEIPTCNHCGDEWYDPGTLKQIQVALQQTAEQALRDIASASVSALTDCMTQRDVEDLLDLSAGYISKLKHKKETPSAALAALLALLAMNTRRVDHLKKVWATLQLGPQLVNSSHPPLDAYDVAEAA